MDRRKFIRFSILGVGIAGTQFSLNAEVNGKNKNVLGMSSGDVRADGAIIWSRVSHSGLVHVEVSKDSAFSQTIHFGPELANKETDYNVKFNIFGLQAHSVWYYRIVFEPTDAISHTIKSNSGRFKTAPLGSSDIRFCWSGDTAGQGYGIDITRGGMKTYQSMLEQNPDFFVHCGDLIYADNPILPQRQLSDGTTWINLTTPPVQKVAETLQEFRERYYYNFLDINFSEFHRNVATLQIWDDHEVTNDWYPNKLLEDDRYTISDVNQLSQRSLRAMYECNPIFEEGDNPKLYRKVGYGSQLDLFLLDLRSYRGPNSNNTQKISDKSTDLLGKDQLAWLKSSLGSSRATWKIVVSSMPLGVKVRNFSTGLLDNAANIDGMPLGREFEVAELLSHLKHNDIRNVHFIAADVHYCASHYFDPDQAQFKDFNPFWEFLSGPLHAGTFGPNEVDNTFGTQVKFHSIPEDFEQNAPPSEGLQFFGKMEIDGKTNILKVSHLNRDGKVLWQHELMP